MAFIRVRFRQFLMKLQRGIANVDKYFWNLKIIFKNPFNLST
jgi:hypothetical protein